MHRTLFQRCVLACLPVVATLLLAGWLSTAEVSADPAPAPPAAPALAEPVVDSQPVVMDVEPTEEAIEVEHGVLPARRMHLTLIAWLVARTW